MITFYDLLMRNTQIGKVFPYIKIADTHRRKTETQQMLLLLICKEHV